MSHRLEISELGDEVATASTAIVRLGEARLRDGDEPWTEARLMFEFRDGGVAMMPRARNGSKRISMSSTDMTDSALALGAALAKQVENPVARVRLSMWPDREPEIEYFGDLSQVRGVTMWVWPDEPGYDGPVLKPRDLERLEDSVWYVPGDGGSAPVVVFLERIRGWLCDRAPGLDEQFSPPATLDRIASLESRLGVTLPSSVRDAWLVHDGESGHAGLLKYEWLSIDAAADAAAETMSTRPDGGVGLIPIMKLDDELVYVASVDAPDDESKVWVYASGDNMEWSIAESFRGYLAWFADACENGDILFEDGHIWRADEY